MIELDFDKIEAKIMGIDTQVQFYFTNLTVQTFAKTFGKMK